MRFWTFPYGESLAILFFPITFDYARIFDKIIFLGLNKTQKKELEEYFVTHSRESDREIGRKFKLSHTTVSKIRKEFYSVIKSEFIQTSVKQSIFEIRRSVDHWKLLIEKLYAELEKNEKEIVIMNNGKKIKTVISLEPLERIRIIHEIADLEVKIQEWGNDPEISQMLKVMSSGKVQQ